MGLFDRNKKKKKQVEPEPVYNDNIITMNDEAGNVVQFEFCDLVELGEHQYCVLLPLNDDSGEVVILEIVDVPGTDQEEYISVDSEETLTAVFEIFKARYKDVYDFQ